MSRCLRPQSLGEGASRTLAGDGADNTLNGEWPCPIVLKRIVGRHSDVGNRHWGRFSADIGEIEE